MLWTFRVPLYTDEVGFNNCLLTPNVFLFLSPRHRWSSIPGVTSRTPVTNSLPTGTWCSRHSGPKRNMGFRCELSPLAVGASTARLYTKRRGSYSEAVRTHNNKSKEKTGLKMTRVKQIDLLRMTGRRPFFAPHSNHTRLLTFVFFFFHIKFYSLHWRRR